jgi:hypothetical protein
MKRAIYISCTLVLLFCMCHASAELTPLAYQMEISYNGGYLKLESMDLKMAPLDSMSPEGRYVLKLLNKDRSVLYSKSFAFPEGIYVTPPQECFDNETGDFVQENCPDITSFIPDENPTASIIVPYKSGGEKIVVYDESGKAALEINLSGYANYCGDGRCGEMEYPFTCPEDCKSGVRDSLCDGESDGLCDPDCNGDQTADPDCAQTTGPGIPWQFYIVLIAAVVIASVAAFIVLRKKKPKDSGYYKPY